MVMAHFSVFPWLFALVAILLIGTRDVARAQWDVDLALVLAVDVSSSMDEEEQHLQRQGYVEAFRSNTVYGAIRSGMTGRIAVMYVDWSDASDQRIIVPWTLIAEPWQALDFARKLELQPTRRTPSATSISGAINFGRQLLTTAPFTASRKVIDISGDGVNNHGRSVAHARARAMQEGIIINGLPLVFKRLDGPDLRPVGRYYHDCVIGGPGAFIIPVGHVSQFAEAIRTKLIHEIAGQALKPLIKLAQGELPMDCQSPMR
jgi:hypothetical protein